MLVRPIPIAFFLFATAVCAAQTSGSAVPQTQAMPASSLSVKTAAKGSKPDDTGSQENSSCPELQKSSGRIKRLLGKGEIRRAAELLQAIVDDCEEKSSHLDSTFHYDSFYDEETKGLEALLLKAAHREAWKFSRVRNYRKAVKTIKSTFIVAPLGMGDILYLNPERVRFMVVEGEEEYQHYGYDKFLPWSEYVEIVNDYGFFLEKANEILAAIDVLERVVKMSPQREVAHLNLADALWKSGDERDAKHYKEYVQYVRQEAAKHYKEYVNLMTAKGRAADIPCRVKTRLRWVNTQSPD